MALLEELPDLGHDVGRHEVGVDVDQPRQPQLAPERGDRGNFFGAASLTHGAQDSRRVRGSTRIPKYTRSCWARSFPARPRSPASPTGPRASNQTASLLTRGEVRAAGDALEVFHPVKR